jgi:hypothetical protein
VLFNFKVTAEEQKGIKPFYKQRLNDILLPRFMLILTPAVIISELTNLQLSLRRITFNKTYRIKRIYFQVGHHTNGGT